MEGGLGGPRFPGGTEAPARLLTIEDRGGRYAIVPDMTRPSALVPEALLLGRRHCYESEERLRTKIATVVDDVTEGLVLPDCWCGGCRVSVIGSFMLVVPSLGVL